MLQAITSHSSSSDEAVVTHVALNKIFPPVGHVLPVTTDVDIAMVERLHPELSPGGRWSPPSCQSRHRVALIMPYRAREAHLAMLMRHLHPFLQRQQLDYTIVVVEQAGENGRA